jgi:hypothetical protein
MAFTSWWALTLKDDWSVNVLPPPGAELCFWIARSHIDDWSHPVTARPAGVTGLNTHGPQAPTLRRRVERTPVLRVFGRRSFGVAIELRSWITANVD